jgi:adenylate cyclase
MMAIEIERKFRVIDNGWRAAVGSSTLLRQGYLANTTRASIRVRLAGDAAVLSVKAMRPGRAREEFEADIAAADAHEMLSHLCEGPLIEKWRHIVVHAGDRWEIDEFLGDNAGLVIAELELDSEEQDFARPAWLGEEVTDDQRYYNFRLSQHPYRQWPQNRESTP